MRAWPLVLLLLAGCTIEVARPPSPTVSTTVPFASPKPAASKRPPATPAPTPSGNLVGPTTPTLGAGEVVRIHIHGGGCMYGECRREYRFHEDGRVAFESGPDAAEERHVDPALVAAVAAEIARADFAALKARPDTDGCPTAYDGSEAIYTFAAPGGPEVLATCTYVLDAAHPLFVATAALEAAATAAAPSPVPASPSPTPFVPGPGPTIGPDDVVLVLRRAGGRCVYGGCETTTTIRADGRFTWTQGPNERREGRVDAALAGALNEAIYRTDFAALEAKPFTGDCPTTYDGQEVTYTFGVPGAEDEVLASCTHEIDESHPLIRAALALEEAARPREE